MAVVSTLRPHTEIRVFYAALWDVAHDLGVALCVSAVIGGLFEYYRSRRHQLESMRDVLELAMSDKITAEVWMDVEALIEKKRAIRRNVFLKLELKEVQGMPEHERVLRVDHDYDLYSLHDKREEFTVTHDLDYQFARPSLDLPRWERAVVRHIDLNREERESSGKQPESLLPKNRSDQRVTFKVSLAPRGRNEYEQVSTSRHEIVNLPGSYNFYVPEFVKGVKISLVGLPVWIEPEVVVRPYGGGDPLDNQQNTWYCEKLLFPGQGIEIKFKELPRNAHAPGAAKANGAAECAASGIEPRTPAAVGFGRREMPSRQGEARRALRTFWVAGAAGAFLSGIFQSIPADLEGDNS